MSINKTAYFFGSLTFFMGLVCWGSERPNVLFILADDIGWGDIGVYHEYQTDTAPVVPTPNLDRLAREGMFFTDAHTPAALCAPTRFSTMTGSNAIRNGRAGGTWSLRRSSAFTADGRKHDTVGDVMQRAGYQTSFFGKMNFGGDAKNAAGNTTRNYDEIDFSRKIQNGISAHGFDYSYGLTSGIQNPPYVYFENDRFAPIDPNRPADNTSVREWNAGTYPNSDGSASVIQSETVNFIVGDRDWDSSKVGDQLSQKAVDYIGNHVATNTANGTDDPFLMYYASQAIHVPHTPPATFDGEQVLGSTITPKTDMIKELDLQVGRILQKLEDEGLADDTLIVFTSDNGGLQGTLAQPEIDQGHSSVGGLRGSKGGPYEGGHRVPFIAKWGDGTEAGSYIKPGSRSDEFVATQDFVATLYDLTRQNMASNQAMDSTSLLPLMFGEEGAVRDSTVLFSNTGLNKRHMIRMDDADGEWILLIDKDRNSIELYNLTNDLTQTTNLINDQNQQARVSSMWTFWNTHADKNDARGTARFVVENKTPFPSISERHSCDFDGDGGCNLDDLNELYSAFLEGNGMTADSIFDLNGDGTVSADDIADWLVGASDQDNPFKGDAADVFKTGDINLDGNVDSADLGQLLNEFGTTASTGRGIGWGGGDINADRNVDSTDLGLLLNQFGFASSPASAVPEPGGTWLMPTAVLIGSLLFRRKLRLSSML